MNRNKNIYVIIISLFTLIMAACSNDRDAEPRLTLPYRIVGTIYQDSLHHDSAIFVYVDDHRSLQCDTLPVVRGHFAFDGSTADIDELHIYDCSGTYHHMYATGGMNTEIEIDSIGKLIYISTDTLNGWLAETEEVVSQRDTKDIVRIIDSICHSQPSNIASGLLIWQHIDDIADSLTVQRLLGSITTEAKPEWLTSNIERHWLSGRERYRKGQRLTAPKLPAADTIIDMAESRRDGMMILLWADHTPASIDTLRELPPRVARQYGLYKYEKKVFDANRRPKRMRLVSICLSAADSLTWHKAVDNLPGQHVWLSGGASDPRIASWYVDKLPLAIVVDQFNNITAIDVWGEELDAGIRRLPNKAMSDRSN